MLTLSICIPSYNRFEKLRETVKEILKAKSKDFEIVIVDNCSPRNIEDFIPCDDLRLRIVKRDKPIYGVKNTGDAILFGKAKYSLLLLDKDSIDGNGLDEFIEKLKNHDVSGGYCVLNSVNNIIDIINLDTMVKFGYLRKHPSGNFYKMESIRDYVIEKSELLCKFPFPFDVYLAYAAYQGPMMYYDSKCVYSALNDFTKDDEMGSLTINKDAENLFYYPKNIINDFKVFVFCLNELSIERDYRIRLLQSLYKKTLFAVTKGYRDIMRDPGICNHYHHKMEQINLKKMLKFAKEFRKVFYQIECVEINEKDKKRIERKAIHEISLKKIRELKKKYKGGK